MRHRSLSFLLAVLLGGCSTGPLFTRAAPPQLVGQMSSWEIKSVWDHEALPGAPIRLTFDGVEKISGFSGCNPFTATYRVDSSGLRITDISAVNARPCPPKVTAQEKRLFDVLSRVHWVRTEDNGTVTLRLLRGDGDPVKLTPARI